MTTQVFVIHLERATARRKNAQNVLDICQTTVGLKGEIWPALDGKNVSSEDLQKHVEPKRFEPFYPFPLKDAEIACFLSHRQTWMEIVNRGLIAGLVLEDDAAFDPNEFAAAYALAKNHIQSCGIIKFAQSAPKGTVHLIDSRDRTHLSTGPQSGLLALAQLISQDTARRLLEQSVTFDRPVDTFIQSHWITGQQMTIVHPGGIRSQSDALEGSTIQGHAPRNTLEKLQREWKRFRYRTAVKRLSNAAFAPPADGS